MNTIDVSNIFARIGRLSFISNVFTLITDASKSLPELTKASEKDTEALVSFYANFIQFEIHVGHLEKAVDIATHCTAKLASQLTSSPVTSSPVTSSVTSSPVTSSVTSPAMTSLMLIKMMDRNLSVLRPDIISQLDHLVSLKTDECVYNYAKYLLKTVFNLIKNSKIY